MTDALASGAWHGARSARRTTSRFKGTQQGPAIMGVLGNVLLFVPFGFIAALRFPKTSWISIALVAVVLATALEIGQALMGLAQLRTRSTS